ncbi:hypothetical protein J7K56_01485 [Candidatus Calescamantes bacterium]|nr:hypothetical protein [Candidatus Calescamantes bacterium]
MREDLYIVCYLDVWGYRGIVKKISGDKKIIKEVGDIFRGITRILNQLKTVSKEGKYSETEKQLLQKIRFTFFSDSFLFALPLFGLRYPNMEISEKEQILECITAYLRIISAFCWIFMGKLCLLRGGIAVGQYYEKIFNSPPALFIISEAWIEAVELEKKANFPRIVLGNSVIEFLKEINEGTLPPCVSWFLCRLTPSDYYFLDIYKDFTFLEKEKAFQILKDIKRLIETLLEHYAKDFEKLGKLYWFARYHNQKVKEINFPELCIPGFYIPIE